MLANDPNVTSTLINVVSTIVSGIVLYALGRMLKSIRGLYRTQQVHGETLRAIISFLRDYGFELPPRINDE